MKVSQELKRVIQSGINARIESHNRKLLYDLVSRHKDVVDAWKKARDAEHAAGKQETFARDRMERFGLSVDCCSHKLELDHEHTLSMNECQLADKVIAELQCKGDDQAPTMADVEKLVGSFFQAEVV